MTDNKSLDYTIKIMLLGETEIGKTCLIQRYVNNSFGINYITTIGIDFQLKIVEIKGKTVKLQIWDTAGQECFKSITKNYFKTSHGFVLAYDITNRKSFECVNDWLKQIRENGNKNIKIVLIGTKCDLDEERVVPIEEGEQLAKENKIQFFETSSKEEINITETFMHIATEIFNSIEKGDLVERTTITIGRDTKKIDGSEPAKKCC